MSVLHRASLSYLLRHPWQLMLTLVGICIGVAVIVAVDLANSSSRKAFQLSMDTVAGEATHQIVGGPNGVDENLYTRLRVEAGLGGIAPLVEGYVRIEGTTFQVLGVDWFAERDIRSFTMGSTFSSSESSSSIESLFAQILTDPGAVLMSQQTAQKMGIQANSEFDVSIDGKTFPASLVGFLGDENAASFDNILVTDIAVAQSWLNQFGWLSRIDVRIREGDQALKAKLESLLPADHQLLNSAGRTQSLIEMSAAFSTNLTAMSLLALLVGIFLIFNSVSFAVLQRRHLIGVLRALGVTRQQVFSLILTESVVLGLLGSAAGLLLGIWLGEHLLSLVSRSINDFYFRVSVTEVSLSLLSLIKGLAVGLGATLLATMVPASEAASYRPSLALTRSVVEHRTGRLLPVLALTGLGLGVLSVMLLSFSGTSLLAGLTAVFMLILGFALCVPLAVKTISTALEPAASVVGGTTLRLAVAGIGANLSRTGVAIVALAVAISATVGVSVMVDSFRGSVSDWLDKSLQSDIYIGAARGALDEDLIQDLVSTPGIAAYSTRRQIWLESESGRTGLIVLQMAPGSLAGTDILDADPTEVWPKFERGNAVLVSEPYAYRNSVGAGDSVSLLTAQGDQSFTIAAVYRSYTVSVAGVLMSRQTYDRFWNDPKIDSLGLYLNEDMPTDSAMAELNVVSKDRQAIFMNSNRDIRELSLQVFDRTFIITDVLYWLATGVALVGILGAMLAMQLERARELAVLRALGMTPGQLGVMVTSQSAVIGLLSGLAAMPLGLVMAWMLINVINRRAFGWQMDILLSPWILLSAVLFSVAAAVLAGLYPAYRAANSQPALVMREE